MHIMCRCMYISRTSGCNAKLYTTLREVNIDFYETNYSHTANISRFILQEYPQERGRKSKTNIVNSSR